MTSHNRGVYASLTALLCAAACATTAPPAKPAAKPEDHAPTLAVQRLQLRVAPLEIVSSGVRGKPASDSIVTVKNVDFSPVVLQSFKLVGEGTDVFQLVNPLGVSRTLMPGQSAEAIIRFEPAAAAVLGVHRATLQIHLADDDMGPLVDVAGLVAEGEVSELEPPLALVIAALGYGVNVGTQGLTLGTGAAVMGDEVTAPLFKRARPGPVAVDPVARYSADGPAPYGFFRPAGKPKLEGLGQLTAGQAQTLNPDSEGEGQISFDPGPEPFGLYVENGKQPLFSMPAMNKGAHAVRVFPLKSRNNEAIADAFVVAFDEAANGDYQDYVFVVWNVVPASP